MMLIKHTAQSGLALIIVLWMLALLSLLGLSYAHTNRAEIQLTRTAMNQAQARAIARAGIQLALHDLLRPPKNRQFPVDGRQFSPTSGTTLRVMDESGKIDLNKASKALLQSLLSNVLEDADRVNAITDAILDWRDGDNAKRLNGAEDDDYSRNAYGYEAKDGPFNSIGELALVMGMDQSLYSRLQTLITVHSMQARVRLSSAPRSVLLSLPDMTEDRVDTIMQTRASDPNASLAPLLPDTVRPYVFSAGYGNVFNITSEANINGMISRTRAVVLMKRSGNSPVTFLDWQEDLSL